MLLSPQDLSKIIPNTPDYLIDTYIGHLNVTMNKYDIITPLRITHFLAQVLHESAGLIYSKEIASGKAYEGRKDLGNVNPGDGVKFKGRGLIQLTGRANYEEYSDDTNIDYVSTPGALELPQSATDVAGWFWATRGLNLLADQDDIKRITKRINGGYNGLANRQELLERAKKVLNI